MQFKNNYWGIQIIIVIFLNQKFFYIEICPSAFRCFHTKKIPKPKIKNNINSIYNTPILIPEAIVVFPCSKDVSAAALQVAHCEYTFWLKSNKLKNDIVLKVFINQ